MRIMFLVNSLGMGGAQRVVSRLANHWASNGHDVAIVTISPASHDFFPIEKNIARYESDLDKGAPSLWGRIKDIARRMFSIQNAVRDFKPDIVISFMTNMNLRAIPLSFFWKAPLIISERGNPALGYGTGLTRFSRRLLYPRAASLVCVSEGVAAACNEVAAHKKTVIYNPVETGETTGAECPREKTVVGLGRLVAVKGFDLLIQAFGQVVPLFPGWRLIIFGEGEERGNLERLADGYGGPALISLPGNTSEPQKELRKAGIFVLSSRHEGFPNALIEAMHAGVPVISTRCPHGPSEIINTGVDGLLVDCGDAGAIAAGLTDLMANEERRDAMGREARRIGDRLGIGSLAGQWEMLFHQVLSGR